MKLDRRAFLKSALGAGLSGAGLASARRKPNVIIILADDMGYADVGFNGCRDYPTPNIDSIAKNGVRFTNGYVSHPFCSPTRSGLMTGRYQQRYGHENNPVYNPKDEISGLPTTEIALPQAIADAGYVTGQIGKWHLGAAPKFHPIKRGFQEQFGFIGGGHDYFKQQREGKPGEYLIPIERNGQAVEEKEYLTDAFSREAVSFIRRHAKHPFFLYLAYNCPHGPQQVSQKYLDRVLSIQDPRRRVYAAMNAALEEGVGQVLATLQELKLDSDTMIFFLSDNGGPVGNGCSNAPLRGRKGDVYEGGIRVPFAARWAGHLPAGKDYDLPVSSLDLLPTVVAVTGARLPSDRPIDGVNLMPYLLDPSKTPHERLFWRTGGGDSYAVRHGRYKLVKIGDKAQLFDLQSDIGETTDISTVKPDVMATLEKARVEWNKQLIPPIFQSEQPARRNAKQKQKA